MSQYLQGKIKEAEANLEYFNQLRNTHIALVEEYSEKCNETYWELTKLNKRLSFRDADNVVTVGTIE